MRARLVEIAGVDLRRFEFDFDLTWYAFLLNADGTIYGRYGGRDAADAHARLSLKGMRFAMQQALAAHAAKPKPRRLTGKPLLAENYLAARRHSGCIHCHNIKEFRRADLRALGKWDRNSLWVYPLPENVGVALDVDVGNRVRTVRRGSPADQVGIKPGDSIHTLNGYPVASFADASYALHKAPSRGAIAVEFRRGGHKTSAKLQLSQGWKKTNLTWRPSMLDILPSLPFAGDDLTEAEKKRLGLSPTRAAFRQDKRVHRILEAAGIRADDVVIGFDGQAVDGEIGDLLGYVRRNYLVGDTIAIDVIRSGKRVEVAIRLN